MSSLMYLVPFAKPPHIYKASNPLHGEILLTSSSISALPNAMLRLVQHPRTFDLFSKLANMSSILMILKVVSIVHCFLSLVSHMGVYSVLECAPRVFLEHWMTYAVLFNCKIASFLLFHQVGRRKDCVLL